MTARATEVATSSEHEALTREHAALVVESETARLILYRQSKDLPVMWTPDEVMAWARVLASEIRTGATP